MAYQKNNRKPGKLADNCRPLWWVLVTKYGWLDACKLVWTDVVYDFVHQIDTARPVGLKGLDDKDRGADYNRYVASTFDAVFASLSHLCILDKHLDFSGCGFVDFGAGKGKALIAAAQQPFVSLTGIEIDAGLHELAASNIHKLGLENRITLLNQDAQNFYISPNDRVLYFFNPFGGETLKLCLENIARARSTDYRYIVYVNPTEDSTYSRFFDKLDEVTFSPGAVEVNYYRTRY